MIPPEDALEELHYGISQLELERLVRETGGAWEQVRRTGEFRVRYACMPKPSGPANGRKKDASRATIGYVRTALRAMVGEAVAAECLGVMSNDVHKLRERVVDQWTTALVDADHEEALGLNAEWLPREERDCLEWEALKLDEEREKNRQYAKKWYQLHKDDPIFKEKCRAKTRAAHRAKLAADPDFFRKQNEKKKADPKHLEKQRARWKPYYRKRRSDPAYVEWCRAASRKSLAKRLAADPDSDKKRVKKYRERIERENPGILAIIANLNNKKKWEKMKGDPVWRAKKNRSESERRARKIAEAKAADPEKYMAEHAAKLLARRTKRAEKCAEAKLLAEIEAEIKAETKL